MTVEIPLDRFVIAPLAAGVGLAALYGLCCADRRYKWMSSDRMWAVGSVLYVFGYAVAASFIPEIHAWASVKSDGVTPTKDPEAAVVVIFILPTLLLVPAVIGLTAYWTRRY